MEMQAWSERGIRMNAFNFDSLDAPCAVGDPQIWSRCTCAKQEPHDAGDYGSHCHTKNFSGVFSLGMEREPWGEMAINPRSLVWVFVIGSIKRRLCPTVSHGCNHILLQAVESKQVVSLRTKPSPEKKNRRRSNPCLVYFFPMATVCTWLCPFGFTFCLFQQSQGFSRYTA